LTTSKTKQVCEIASFFEVGNIKNEAILRDFLQTWKVECRADGLVPISFAIFSTPPVLNTALATFDKVHNPVRLPRETTSERPKVLRTRQFFALLTSKCASRHNGVHFSDIATSKSGPELVCFVHFDFEMCFVPQRRALLRHRNFQKWSGAGVFCAF